MSYVRAVEGDTNAQVLDAAFHRRVQPPSQARELRTTGIPAPPVSSIRRAQLFSFPRPYSSTATADLRGQSRVAVSATPAVRRQGNIISAQRSAAIAQQRRDRQRAVAVLLQRRKQSRGMSGLGDDEHRSARALSVAQAIAAYRIGPGGVKLGTVLRKSGMHGLGQTVSTLDFSLPTLPPVLAQPIAYESAAAQIAALKAPPSPAYAQIIANQLVQTGAVSGTDAVLFRNLSTVAQQNYLKAAQVNFPAAATPSVTAGITDWLNQQAIAGIPNVALAAGAGLFVLILSQKKGRR